jgi:hypothetical protein
MSSITAHTTPDAAIDIGRAPGDDRCPRTLRAAPHRMA